MITQEQLDADKAAVDAAQAQLTKDQAAFDAVLPHLSVLQEIESYAVHLEEGLRQQFADVLAKARALF